MFKYQINDQQIFYEFAFTNQSCNDFDHCQAVCFMSHFSSQSFSCPPPLLTPPLYPIQAYCHLSPSVDIANIIWNRNHWSMLSHSVRVAPVSTVLDYTNVIVVTLSQARKQWCLCERDSFGLVISVLLREHNGTFAIHNQQLCTQS